MINRATLLGRLGSDVELKTSNGGNSFCTFSLATSEKYKDKSGETVEQTEWHRIVAFGKGAETLAKWAKKGGLLYVEGKINTREYTDKEGASAKMTQIICDNFRLVGGDKKEDTATKKPSSKPASNKKEEYYDDDVPF